jgi:[protein-PII] uridylyltransferase
MLETVARARRRRSRLVLPHSAFFNKESLRVQVAALHGDGRDPIAVRRDVIALFRCALDHGRGLARRSLEANGGGLACAGQLAHIEDELIHAIHHYVTTHVVALQDRDPATAYTIVAVGGYGRATLAPGSDIDLLFLLPDAPTRPGERVVEAILYVLWDLGQKVGHSTRTVDECLSEARQDMTVRTALLEARFLLGRRSLFEVMRTRFEHEIVAGTAAEFVTAKLAERDRRITRAGRSRYLVEPNVKDGKGGLRDLNTLFWIAKYAYQVRDVEDLVGAGMFSPSEFRLFRRCEEFLWRVRCHLHCLTGRAEERLGFELQRQIADRLGYSTRGALASVERFMKHYFLVAKDVGDLSAIVCAALEERQAKPYAALDRSFGPRLPFHDLPLTGDFVVDNGRVNVSASDAFERDPVNLIRLYWVADRNGLAIHPGATRLVTSSLKRIDATLRNDPEANRLFLGILTSRNTPETVLRLMNEAGVLGRFVPEFGRIVALMQFNMYHHFTVDEHLLRAVGNLADLEKQRSPQEHRLACEILPSIGNRTALYLALFLHDIAKGRTEDHSMAGVDVTRILGPRLRLPEAVTETVAWLVEHHLDMSDTAQRRDLGDPRTILTFASKVQTLERLKMLFVMTICDICAVGPGVWNNWKGELLRTLYWETEVVLTGGYSATDRKRRVAQAQEELRRNLPAWSDLDFAAYAARHAQAYWLKVDLPHKVLHAKLSNMTEVEMPHPVIHIVADSSRGVTEFTVVAPDHTQLLSTIAGACAAASANIVDAQVFTTTDGMALDTINVSRAFDYDEDEMRRAGRIALSIELAVRGEIKLADLVAARAGASNIRANAFTVHPEVSFDNTLSNRLTIVEVSGLDRPGLLYDLTSSLARLDLDIASAHIATFGEKFADVFYVTDLAGGKITSEERQATIRTDLLRSFSDEPEVARTCSPAVA